MGMSDLQRAMRKRIKLRPAQIAALFRISERTARRWCARGIVPGARQTRGGHWRITTTTGSWRGIRVRKRRLNGTARTLDYPTNTAPFIERIGLSRGRFRPSLRVWRLTHPTSDEKEREEDRLRRWRRALAGTNGKIPMLFLESADVVGADPKDGWFKGMLRPRLLHPERWGAATLDQLRELCEIEAAQKIDPARPMYMPPQRAWPKRNGRDRKTVDRIGTVEFDYDSVDERFDEREPD